MTEPAHPDWQPPLPAPEPPGTHGGGGASTQTHGFLFADLRGFTDFADSKGDHAAAELLERYRALVREAVASSRGAEIRTEGDSFYVVFDSVSAGVQCGLAIVEAAAVDGPTGPIRVGVGLHAGETVQTADGFVGSPVNIAARLCAEALAGELVVSDTVRSLTRTYLDVAFEPLGARRLKGVAEPIIAYRVVPRGAATHTPESRPARRWPPRVLTAVLGSAVIVAIVAGGAFVLSGRGREAPTTPGPSSAAATASITSAPASPAGSPGGSPVAAASTSAAPVASPTVGPFPTEVETAILAALPSSLAKTCVRGGTPSDARLAGFRGFVLNTAYQPPRNVPVTPSQSRGGVTCHPGIGAVRLYVMRPLPFDPAGKNASGGDEYLGLLTGRHEIPDGSCATEDRAHERWRTSRGTGLVACLNPYDGRPWIYFSFGDGRYLGFATRDDSDYGALYAWWQQLKTFLP